MADVEIFAIFGGNSSYHRSHNVKQVPLHAPQPRGDFV